MTPQTAQNITRAMCEVKQTFSQGAPAPLSVGDLCETCHNCNYFQASVSDDEPNPTSDKTPDQ